MARQSSCYQYGQAMTSYLLPTGLQTCLCPTLYPCLTQEVSTLRASLIPHRWYWSSTQMDIRSRPASPWFHFLSPFWPTKVKLLFDVCSPADFDIFQIGQYLSETTCSMYIFTTGRSMVSTHRHRNFAFYKTLMTHTQILHWAVSTCLALSFEHLSYLPSSSGL